MADMIRARHMPRLMPRSPCWWSLGLRVNAASPKMRTSLNNMTMFYFYGQYAQIYHNFTVL